MRKDFFGDVIILLLTEYPVLKFLGSEREAATTNAHLSNFRYPSAGCPILDDGTLSS